MENKRTKRNESTRRDERPTRKPRIKQFNKNGIKMDSPRPPKVFRESDNNE